MEANKEITKIIVSNIQHKLNCLEQDVKENLQKMKKAETVEEVMEIKQQILLNWLSWVPLDGGECYFCLETKLKCAECGYAKVHGRCAEKNSDYAEISDALWTLRREILSKYYVGEKY